MSDDWDNVEALEMAQDDLERVREELAAARARLDEVLRLGREMREVQRKFVWAALRIHMDQLREELPAAEAAFDAELARGNTAALSPGDNAAGS